MDKIIISALQVEAVIGILAWERQIKQKLVLDLELGVDISKAAATDSIVDAVDYSIISKQVTEFVAGSECQLIEPLAQNTAQFILQNFPVQNVKLTLSKPGAIKSAENVAITVERFSK